MHSVKTTAYDQKIRDKLRINRQFIHKNEKLKRLTRAISSHKYVVPVLRKSDRLHNNHAIITVITIPFVQMTERDERRNWWHIKILFYAIKIRRKHCPHEPSFFRFLFNGPESSFLMWLLLFFSYPTQTMQWTTVIITSSFVSLF